MTHIYHITHLTNLPSIIDSSGLFCDRMAQNIGCVRVGHQHIKQRRLNREVPIAPGECVGDYVPFYFAPRSPMLYAIHRGVVEGYTGGESEVVHLISSVEAVCDARLAWIFTDGHAEMAPLTEFYDDLRHLDKIDWPLMKARYWHDTNDDPDRKRRRQAEFLVHEFFPWELVLGIGVYDRSAELAVRRAIENAEHKPELRVAREWYY